MWLQAPPTFCLKRACMLSHFSRVRLFATLWTVAHQALLSTGFSRQEYWSGLPCLPPGHLPNPGIKLTSPAMAGEFSTPSTTWEALSIMTGPQMFLECFLDTLQAIPDPIFPNPEFYFEASLNTFLFL